MLASLGGQQSGSPLLVVFEFSAVPEYSRTPRMCEFASSLPRVYEPLVLAEFYASSYQVPLVVPSPINELHNCFIKPSFKSKTALFKIPSSCIIMVLALPKILPSEFSCVIKRRKGSRSELPADWKLKLSFYGHSKLLISDGRSSGQVYQFILSAGH